MFTIYALFLLLPFVAIAVALTINVVRTYRVKVACYRRMGVPSLTRAVKARAVARYLTF